MKVAGVPPSSGNGIRTILLKMLITARATNTNVSWVDIEVKLKPPFTNEEIDDQLNQLIDEGLMVVLHPHKLNGLYGPGPNL